ncbi:hypothetical protein NQZ68_025453 [Dissostichus eleginoides]|nr:hypothetical protein NQZ68_025453 [Dissostichus eleginoides]
MSCPVVGPAHSSPPCPFVGPAHSSPPCPVVGPAHSGPPCPFVGPAHSSPCCPVVGPAHSSPPCPVVRLAHSSPAVSCRRSGPLQPPCVLSETVDYQLITETDRLCDQLIVYSLQSVVQTLQCPVTGFSEDKPPYWETDLFNNHQGKDNLSVGVVDQNYSLVLTSIRTIGRRDTGGRLVISDVSLQDTGEYWCAVDDEYDQCMFSSKTVLKHRDPFGVHSTFYAVRCSALSVLLLMLCVAVVTVTLRTRTRDT